MFFGFSSADNNLGYSSGSSVPLNKIMRIIKCLCDCCNTIGILRTNQSPRSSLFVILEVLADLQTSSIVYTLEDFIPYAPNFLGTGMLPSAVSISPFVARWTCCHSLGVTCSLTDLWCKLCSQNMNSVACDRFCMLRLLNKYSFVRWD